MRYPMMRFPSSMSERVTAFLPQISSDKDSTSLY